MDNRADAQPERQRAARPGRRVAGMRPGALNRPMARAERRFCAALLLSLAAHAALLLSLRLGGDPDGTPGLAFIWQQRGNGAPPVRVVLAMSPRTAPAAAELPPARSAEAAAGPPVLQQPAPVPALEAVVPAPKAEAPLAPAVIVAAARHCEAAPAVVAAPASAPTPDGPRDDLQFPGAAVRAVLHVDAAQRRLILSGNAQRLFPRFAA